MRRACIVLKRMNWSAIGTWLVPGLAISYSKTHTQPFNGLWSGTTRVGRYQKKLTHSHPSWSSDILYQLPPFTTIHDIHSVHFTCLTVLSYNLSPSPLWSSSWSWTLNFIHFFTQSSSSFRSTCPYQRSLFCCNTNAMSSMTMLKHKHIFQIIYIRKHFYQPALGNCYGLKLATCWLQFKK